VPPVGKINGSGGPGKSDETERKNNLKLVLNREFPKKQKEYPKKKKRKKEKKEGGTTRELGKFRKKSKP